MELFNSIKQFLVGLDENNIHFKKHFYDKIRERPISEGLVKSSIKKTEKLLAVEKQRSRIPGQEKYKFWIKLSNRYSLVVVAAISKKDLYIITAWNTDRKWQKELQK